MCAKFNKILFGAIPGGFLREWSKSSYYRFYYNLKHYSENRFHVFYSKRRFIYKFPDGIIFMCNENIADELKRSLFGYIARHKLREGEIVIDCGAYIGEFTLYAAKAVGSSGKVIAFEPNESDCQKLLANLRLNDLDSVIVIKKGVWSSDCVKSFSQNQGSSFLKEDPEAVAVPVVSLDKELGRLNIRRVNFIKMDIEGAELEAVRGAENILKNNKVNLAIASYHPVNGQKSCFELEKLLASMGYSSETSHPKRLTTYAWKKG